MQLNQLIPLLIRYTYIIQSIQYNCPQYRVEHQRLLKLDFVKAWSLTTGSVKNCMKTLVKSRSLQESRFLNTSWGAEDLSHIKSSPSCPSYQITKKYAFSNMALGLIFLYFIISSTVICRSTQVLTVSNPCTRPYIFLFSSKLC